MKRILSAALFLPVFWVIVKKLGPGMYYALLALAALLALREFYRLAEARGHRCHRVLGAAITTLTMASFVDARIDLEYALALGLIVLPLLSLRRGGDWGKAFGDIGTSFFIAVFVGMLFGYLMKLRVVGDPLPAGGDAGADLVFLLFLIVWGSDTAAFYVGSFFGRHPLAPLVSPKKTIEGAVGGILGALAMAFLARAWFMHRLHVHDCLVLGVALGTIGMLGDLVESMLKRGAGLKDSAALVPGHGGILDRVDSLLYAAPFLYYYYVFAMRAH
jgi:phosphatidate cytidylyltransferase